MSCWDVLGITPTRDPAEIENAYRQQAKFVEADDARQLDEAYREAMAQAGQTLSEPELEEIDASVEPDSEHTLRELSAGEHQLVREVIIQVQALLNDESRCRDVAVWKAVLTDPPADQNPTKQALSDKLEGQLRPMARQGGLPADVAGFLASWFGWSDIVEAELSVLPQEPESQSTAMGRTEGLERAEDPETPPTTNFWPAAIGWIVGLIVLTSLFSNLTGQ